MIRFRVDVCENERRELNMTLPEFAEYLEIGTTTYQRFLYEKGIPSVKTLYQISEKLDIPMDFLITSS